jgi:hypothetical protein
MSLPEPTPNTALHLTAYSLRFAALRSGFRQQMSLGVGPRSARWLPLPFVFRGILRYDLHNIPVET